MTGQSSPVSETLIAALQAASIEYPNPHDEVVAISVAMRDRLVAVLSAGLAQTPAVPQDMLRKMHHLASICCDEDVLRWFDAHPAVLADTSTDGEGK